MANELENPVPDPRDPRGVEYRAWLATPWMKKDQIRMLNAMIAGYEVNGVRGMLDAGLLSARTRVRTPKLPKTKKARFADGKTLGMIWSGLPRYVRVFHKGEKWAPVCRICGCVMILSPGRNNEEGAWLGAVTHWTALHRKKPRPDVVHAKQFRDVLPDEGKGWVG